MALLTEKTDSPIGKQLGSLFVSTGCTSSDIMLAPVLAELQNRHVVGEMMGLGGAPLRDVGVQLLYDSTIVSTVGPIQGIKMAVRNAYDVVTTYRKLQRLFLDRPPTLVVLVDNAGLNLKVLALAKRRKIPVIYFVPPERWSIWRGEGKRIANDVDLMVPIFRHEATGYRSDGGRVFWMGHPLVDLLGGFDRRAVNARRHSGPITDPRIALFPGSRSHEVDQLLPIMRGACEILHQKYPKSKFVICSANELSRRLIRDATRNWSVAVESVHRRSHETLADCDLVLTCSGTATLEAGIMGVPMVAVYRLNEIVDRFIRYFVLPEKKYPYFSLPNFLTGRKIVPELSGPEASAEGLARAALHLIEHPSLLQKMADDLRLMRDTLGPPGAVQRVSDLFEKALWAAKRGGVEAVRNLAREAAEMDYSVRAS